MNEIVGEVVGVQGELTFARGGPLHDNLNRSLLSELMTQHLIHLVMKVFPRCSD